jgi:hypothetical protein
VFKQAWKILDELPYAAHSESETDTRIICTSENDKKELKWVRPVFNPAWKILAELPIEQVSDPKTDTRIMRMSEN